MPCGNCARRGRNACRIKCTLPLTFYPTCFWGSPNGPDLGQRSLSTSTGGEKQCHNYCRYYTLGHCRGGPSFPLFHLPHSSSSCLPIVAGYTVYVFFQFHHINSLGSWHTGYCVLSYVIKFNVAPPQLFGGSTSIHQDTRKFMLPKRKGEACRGRHCRHEFIITQQQKPPYGYPDRNYFLLHLSLAISI